MMPRFCRRFGIALDLAMLALVQAREAHRIRH